MAWTALLGHAVAHQALHRAGGGFTGAFQEWYDQQVKATVPVHVPEPGELIDA